MPEIPENNLATFRQLNRWSQADVGDYLNMSAVTVCRHETCVVKLTPTVLQKYCRLYNTDVNDLFDISQLPE